MNLYVYILVMALTTYLIRMLPLTLFQKEIKSRFLRSFLAYVPCACLAAMTFPAILYATNSVFSGLAGLVVAVLLAFFGKSLVTVAACSCAAVFVSEQLLSLL
ncbi:AzlD domain-containing protein [Fournierella massiliensis]|nr:AzlD domain-containing protein [Fournierella massiliensis]MCF2557280.1 AzlD domain-containing protein [Fournierella massiliensis]